jgi:hypothetical protein
MWVRRHMGIAFIPPAVIEWVNVKPEVRHHVNVLVSNAAICIALVCISAHPNLLDLIPHRCLFRAVLSIPCPGCGVTRSLMASVTGNFVSAFHINPAGVVVLVSVAAEVPLRLSALRWRSRCSLVVCLSERMTFLTASSLLIVWLASLITKVACSI